MGIDAQEARERGWTSDSGRGTARSTAAIPHLETNVTIDGFDRIDFDKKKIRKALSGLGIQIRNEARRLVARRAISGAGDYPGKKTGALRRSIKHKVSRSGFMVVIRPEKTAEMGKDFYPAYLHYGVRRHRSLLLAKQHRRQPEGPYRIAPRRNFMTDVLEGRREVVRHVLRIALQDSLIPRK